METIELTILKDILKELKLFEKIHDNNSDEAALDINKLVAEFGKMCPDILTDIDDNKGSQATQFVDIVLWELGSEFSKMKVNEPNNKIYRMHFPAKTEEIDVENKQEKNKTEKEPSNKTVLIYSNENLFQESNSATHMNITLKQANLIAMIQLQKLIKYACIQSEPKYLMTPWSTNIFAKHDIKDMAKELKMNPCDVLIIINTSCLPDGHILPASNINCAIACTVFNTRGLNDENARRSIIKNTSRQYYYAKKSLYSISKVSIWMKYATGGIPYEMIKLFKQIDVMSDSERK